MLFDRSEDIRCQECGQPLSSWAEPHSWDDCQWWKATQPTRDVLVGLGSLQAELNRIAEGA